MSNLDSGYITVSISIPTNTTDEERSEIIHAIANDINDGYREGNKFIGSIDEVAYWSSKLDQS